jgi:DNA-binding NarL/FixJ family response regulator
MFEPGRSAEEAVLGAPRTKLLLVDDHEVVRIGLRQLFDSQPDLVTCGEAATIAEAQNAVAVLEPHVVILDLTLENENGLDLLRWLEREDHGTRVLVLSMYDESLYSDDAVALGARGYVMKDAPPAELLRAVRLVAGGGVYLSERLTQRVMKRVAAGREIGPAPADTLTAREQEVVELLSQALTTKEIAARMGTAIKTIDSHKRNICEKLGLDSAAALLRYAVVNGRQRRTS